jgi:hypothetical protein
VDKENSVPTYTINERGSVCAQNKDKRNYGIRAMADLNLDQDIDCSGLFCSLISSVLQGLYIPEQYHQG